MIRDDHLESFFFFFEKICVGLWTDLFPDKVLWRSASFRPRPVETMSLPTRRKGMAWDVIDCVQLPWQQVRIDGLMFWVFGSVFVYMDGLCYG